MLLEMVEAEQGRDTMSVPLFHHELGNLEMCFDTIRQMWFKPPEPALLNTQPPAMDR